VDGHGLQTQRDVLQIFFRVLIQVKAGFDPATDDILDAGDIESGGC
jgi:hypothetical protein